MKEFIDLSGEMKVVLHRAFDVCKDPFVALEKLISLGIDTILTSGQQNNCLAGIDLIKELNDIANDKISIMAGGGMNSDVIEKFLNETEVKSFHMSAKKVLESKMKYRNLNVNMGMPGLSEYEIWRTNEDEVRKVYEILKKYS